jgi:hypothetical protein
MMTHSQLIKDNTPTNHLSHKYHNYQLNRKSNKNSVIQYKLNQPQRVEIPH